jgi:radical SAM-linked protein
VKFAKAGKIRWTSHRDLARMWERAFRRTQLPLAYSSGFSPRPKVSFGLALSTGHESVAEYLDLDIDPARQGEVDLRALPSRLTAALPAGVDVLAAAAIDDRAESLQHEVTSCRYEIMAAGATSSEMEQLVAAALASESLVITRERKGQAVTDDVRASIVSVTIAGNSVSDDGRPCVSLDAELATQPRGLRPVELLAALSPALEEVRVRRTHQWISRADGAREEPLPLDALGEPPVPQLERVS